MAQSMRPTQYLFRPGSILFLGDPAVTASNQSTASVAVSISATRFGGRQNASGHVGVYFHRRTGRWAAMVNLVSRERKHVGLADTPAEAAALRDDYIAKHGTVDPRAKVSTVMTGQGA